MHITHNNGGGGHNSENLELILSQYHPWVIIQDLPPDGATEQQQTELLEKQANVGLLMKSKLWECVSNEADWCPLEKLSYQRIPQILLPTLPYQQGSQIMFGSIKTLTSGDFGNMRADCTVQWRTSTVTRELNFTPTPTLHPSQYSSHSPLMPQPS